MKAFKKTLSFFLSSQTHLKILSIDKDMNSSKLSGSNKSQFMFPALKAKDSFFV